MYSTSRSVIVFLRLRIFRIETYRDEACVLFERGNMKIVLTITLSASISDRWSHCQRRVCIWSLKRSGYIGRTEFRNVDVASEYRSTGPKEGDLIHQVRSAHRCHYSTKNCRAVLGFYPLKIRGLTWLALSVTSRKNYPLIQMLEVSFI
jgi:hypothetical protein